MCPATMADRKKQQPLPSDSHFGLYFHFYLSVSQRRPCECVWSRASTWQTEEQVMWRCWCLDWVCSYPLGCVNWMSLTSGIRGGRQERGEGGGKRVSWMTTLSLSLSSLSGLRGAPRVKTLPLAASFVSSISGIQTQLCTRMHKHANGRTLTCSHKYPWNTASSLEHTHTHTLSRLRQVFMLS